MSSRYSKIVEQCNRIIQTIEPEQKDGQLRFHHPVNPVRVVYHKRPKSWFGHVSMSNQPLRYPPSCMFQIECHGFARSTICVDDIRHLLKEVIKPQNYARALCIQTLLLCYTTPEMIDPVARIQNHALILHWESDVGPRSKTILPAKVDVEGFIKNAHGSAMYAQHVVPTTRDQWLKARYIEEPAHQTLRRLEETLEALDEIGFKIRDTIPDLHIKPRRQATRSVFQQSSVQPLPKNRDIKTMLDRLGRLWNEAEKEFIDSRTPEQDEFSTRIFYCAKKRHLSKMVYYPTNKRRKVSSHGMRSTHRLSPPCNQGLEAILSSEWKYDIGRYAPLINRKEQTDTWMKEIKEINAALGTWADPITRFAQKLYWKTQDKSA